MAGPVTSIFNSSLREGVLPKFWKTATVIYPLPKKRPPESIEIDIRPIALILLQYSEGIRVNLTEPAIYVAMFVLHMC